MPLLTRRTQIETEDKTTAGASSTFSVADVISTEIYDPEFAIAPEFFDRATASEFVGTTASIVGSKVANLNYSMDLVNLGQATAPPVDLQLKGCGLAVTGGTSAAWVYTPSQTPTVLASGGPVLLDQRVYEDGRRKTQLDAAGTFTLTLTRGQPGVFAFQFQGNGQTAPDDASLYASVVRSTTLPTPFVGADLEWDDANITGYCINSVTFDLGAAVSLLPCATAANGYERAIVTDFAPTITLEVDAPLVATDDIYTDYLNGTLRKFEVGFSGFRLTAFNCQITDISEGDRNGVRINTLTLALRRPAYSASENRLFIMEFDNP